jgi:hypothetical protein
MNIGILIAGVALLEVFTGAVVISVVARFLVAFVVTTVD